MATTSTYLSLILPVIADTAKIVDDFNYNMGIIDGRFSATYMAVQAKNAVAITGGSITGITDLVVADGGTGVSTLTDGGVLLGSGTSAITAMAVLTDGQMIVGNGTTDPVAESGATLRTSIDCTSRALDNISSCAINTSLLLGSSDGGALGSITYMWSDLFLASGAVINFNNGDVTLTHSANTLTLGGGIFIVSRASETTATNAAWFTLGSTVATGDLAGLRTIITSNATSGGGAATGVNVRGVYGQAMCTATKHAGLLQGGLFTASAAAGTVYNVHVLCGHYSSGGATTIGGDLYVGYLRAQTRQSGRSVTGNDCLLALENEAVSGTGQVMDSAIRIFDTNMGVDGFTYGIDMSSADITTADIILQNGETISNTTDGTIAIGAHLTATSFGGITSANLLDKSATETVSGTWTFAGAVDMSSLTLDTALAIAEGGTNSTTALNNDRVMVSNSGAIAESATITVTELGLLNGVTGTLATTSNKLSAFAATTSAELAGVISDETGTLKLVYSDSPTFTTKITTPTIDLTGGQIAFPSSQNASGDANTLDDYEEGTWTMGVSFGGGTTGITYTENTGYYTKIGNTVTISGYLELSSKGESTGNALATGLPFTVVNNSAGYAAVALQLNSITFANQFQGLANKNTTTIVLREITEAGTLTFLTDADFANDSSIAVNCTYRAN